MGMHIIWDFDGTLGYREGMWTGALAEVLRRYAPDCLATEDHLRPHLRTGYPWHEPHRPYPVRSAAQWWDDLAPVFARAFIAVGVAAPQARDMAREVGPVFADPQHWRLFPDTLPTLRGLSARGWTHAILSNHVPELPRLIAHLGLGPHIARVFNSAETGFEKPHPQAFRLALDALGSSEAVWMVGDNPVADVAGAEAAGLPAILVRTRAEGVRFQCDDLPGVEDFLGRGT